MNQVVSFINGGSFSGSLVYAGAESVRQRKERFFRNAVLTKVGKKYGKSVGQTGLKFLIRTGVSAAPKASSVERMKENIDIFDFDLDEEDLSKISVPDENRTLFGWY